MNHLKGITAIIFDLGGVIVDLDIDKTRTALSKLLGGEQPDLYYSHHHLPLFSDYEVGQISDAEFIAGLQRQSMNGTSHESIIEAWNAMLVGIPQSRIQMLERLTKTYRLFILSNTNAIHTERFEKMASGYNKLSELFEDVYYSHLIGSRKPNKEIFEAVIKKSNLDPSSTLFVDDLSANIEAAQNLGFKTLHIKPGMDIAGLL